MAKSNLEAMLIQCAKTPEADASTEDFLTVQKKSLHDVIHELVRQVTSPNTLVREQVHRLTIFLVLYYTLMVFDIVIH